MAGSRGICGRRPRSAPRGGAPGLRRTATVLAAGLLVVGVTTEALPAAQLLPRDTASAVHLLQRATFGARPADVDRVLQLGVEGWLWEQTSPGVEDSRLVSLVEERFPSTTLDVEGLLEAYPERRAPPLNPDSVSPEEARRMRQERARSSPRVILAGMTGAKLMRAAHGERQLEEVMVDFWFDHFNVFFQKGSARWLVQDYERNAIRPHVFGTFEEMLVATASHPAMLFYLDNVRSGGVDTADVRANLREMARMAEGGAGARVSFGGGRGGRPGRGARGARGAPGGRGGLRPSPGARSPRLPFDPEGPLPEGLSRALPGLNENYARELLELHTLGVDGGYTQEDVVAVARAFTGWTFAPPRRGGRGSMAPGRQELITTLALGPGHGPAPPPPTDPYAFWFRPEIHDRGPKTVLGQTLPADRGMEDGVDVLRILANHPSTARHVAEQLSTRFVADDPPAALVERLAGVFLDTGGDLGEVTRALFTSPEFYDEANRDNRTKPPFTLVASALRVTGARVDNPAAVMELLTQLGQAPYLASAPTGYPEESAAWESAGATVHRANFGLALASGRLRGVRVDPEVVRGLALSGASRSPSTSGEGLARLAAGLVDASSPGATGLERERTVDAVRAALGDADGGLTPGSLAAALGLALASPTFQKH